MTIISPDAQARREAARENGRFGAQAHTAPELAFDASRVDLDELWEERQAAATVIAETDVALIAARLHWSIAGVRFTAHDGQLIPSRLIPASVGPADTEGEHLAGDLHLLTAYAQNKNAAVHLEAVHDGTEGWEWRPDGRARAVRSEDAEAASLAAREDFRASAHALSIASEEHLTTRMPDGIGAVDIVFLEDGNAVFGYAYDESGEPTVTQFASEEWADYRLIASRAPDTVHRIADARNSDILGTHFHLARR